MITDTRLTNLLMWRNDYPSDAAFANAIGMSASFFGQLKRGERSVGEKLARKIEARLSKPTGALDLQETPNEETYVQTSKSVLLWDDVNDLPEGEFVLVDQIDAKAACGDGYTNGDYPVHREPLAFRTDFIKRSKARSTQLKTIDASGDSMLPTICDGDCLLLDLTQNRVENGNVYAFVVEGQLFVKRLYLHNGLIVAHSDNQQDPRYKYDEQYSEDTPVKIIGRVVHRGGSGGL